MQHGLSRTALRNAYRFPLALGTGLLLLGCQPRVDHDVRPELAHEGLLVTAEGRDADSLSSLVRVFVTQYQRQHAGRVPALRRPASYMLVAVLITGAGDRHAVTGRLVDVRTSAIPCSVTVEIQGDSVVGAVRQMVTELLRRPLPDSTRCQA
jgi:hypothetical protein